MRDLNIIIDTDAGIDDAIALIMVASEPNANILGITAVSGNTSVNQVVKNIGHVLDLLDVDIPIYSGASVPLVCPNIHSSEIMGADGFGNISGILGTPKREKQKEVAGLALIRLVHETQNPVSIIALGPLTNIALAVRLDPLLPKRIEKLVIMGGAVEAKGNTTPLAEFNFFADPEAASIIFRSGFKNIWLIPWETSLKHMLLWEDFEKITKIKTDKALFLEKMTAMLTHILKNSIRTPGMPMPDPIAAAVALYPEIVEEEHYKFIEIETNGSISRGMVSVDWGNVSKKDPNAHIVMRINQDKFEELLNGSLI